jgi:hypothetical protein
MTANSEDSRVRRQAAQWLPAEAERRENLEVVRTPDQPEENPF